jgi:hypothetical protein
VILEQRVLANKGNINENSLLREKFSTVAFEVMAINSELFIAERYRRTDFGTSFGIEEVSEFDRETIGLSYCVFKEILTRVI